MRKNMKKFVSFILVLFISAFAIFANETYTKIEGPEKVYNQIRIINESSVTSFMCRVVILKDLGDSKYEKDYVYGIYNLDGDDDSDSNTNKIKRGKMFCVEFEEKNKDRFSYYVDYRDYPGFDVVVIHITDKDSVVFEKKI